MKPGQEALVDLAARTLPPTARVLDLGGSPTPSPRLAGRRIVSAADDEAMPFLAAQQADPFDAILASWPTRSHRLMPLLDAMHAALRADGVALVCDLVWHTAPSLDLIQAFAPPPGLEKVRPIEGYEMQVEHTRFDVASKEVVDRARWVPQLPPTQRAAVEADTRGAARLMLWTLRPSEE